MSEAERGPSRRCPASQARAPSPAARCLAPRAPSPLTGCLFSSIQHLGAEIHLIRDMMDPVHTGGLYDFLLTALEVRDRNAPATGADAFPTLATVGMSSLTFTTCVPPWEGSPPSSGPALVKGAGRQPQCLPGLGTGPQGPECVPARSRARWERGGPIYCLADCGESSVTVVQAGRWALPGVRPGSLCRWRGAGRAGVSASPLSFQSCYEHLQRDDMHRLPSHWDSREPW